MYFFKIQLGNKPRGIMRHYISVYNYKQLRRRLMSNTKGMQIHFENRAEKIYAVRNEDLKLSVVYQ